MYPNTESLIDLWDQRLRSAFSNHPPKPLYSKSGQKGIGKLRISIAMIAHEVVLFVFGHLDLPA